MLSARHVFPLMMINESSENLQHFIAEDPAPGIDPIPDARVLRIEPCEDGDDGLPLVTAHVEMSVESFVRTNVQYGVDPYDILLDVKDICGKDVAVVAHQFLTEATDLTVAHIQVTQSQIAADQWPAHPEL